MRLKNIKLAGFKSFVEPTTVLLPSNLTALVGPNGCGKSNIIDAVRWVMGESSAKQLRGESLDDVIFNGSIARKPASHAAIELHFDNSAGTLQGQYASYSEIAIRREITRDGQSNYYLNGTRCRRRDIVDLFLGTGLGPRSYAIIEQGMISRLIEAKPEELRAYIEEAAGIARYKERRRETESRIHHTQENLLRLNDIREELAKQLNHLQRQANAAERYKVLKQDERLLKAQILTLRWRSLNAQVIEQAATIQAQEADLAAAMSAQQQLEGDLNHHRELQTNEVAQSNDLQAQYYQTANEVTRLEQTIQNHRERQQQWELEKSTIATLQQQIQQQLLEVEHRVEDLFNEVEIIVPDCEQAKVVAQQSMQALAQAEQQLHDWQVEWDALNHQMAQSSQRAEVEHTRVRHLQQRLDNLQQRISRLQDEHNHQQLELEGMAVDDFDKKLAHLHDEHSMYAQQLEDIVQGIATQREQNQQLSHELDLAKNQMQTFRGQQASLEALQQVALGQREETTMEWLKQHELADLPRLAQVLQVESGWERALETVLERHLQAVCVDELSSLEPALNNVPQANLSFVAKSDNVSNTSSTKFPTLLEKVHAPLSLANLIANIYIAETIHDALEISNTLAAHQSVVTRDGTWFGNGWLYIAHKTDDKTGVLQRERELAALRQAAVEAATHVEKCQQAFIHGNNHLHELEATRDSTQRQIAELVALQADIRTKQQVHQAHMTQIEQRARQISAEIADCTNQLQLDQEAREEAQIALDDAQASLKQHAAVRETLQQAKTDYQAVLEAVRTKAQHEQDLVHQLELRIQAAKLQLESSQQDQIRLQQKLQELKNRNDFLEKSLTDNSVPMTELVEKLQTLTAEKLRVEEQLTSARQRVEQAEQRIRELEQQRHQTEQRLLDKRNELEQTRLAAQAHEVRAKSLEEQIKENGYDAEALLLELPADSTEQVWEENLQQITRKIERLGPINLAAIDEYTVQNERKTYLDTQCLDLEDALNTLQDAINKMDAETALRFKETYEKINENFQTIFPTLFGGGRASLQLGDEDLLSAGVTVMAQPPGKRNSTIHLLSGGEKALTAIAVIFALFQLNPAPFCMLDEVDAPLDDANVGRFCNLVKQMSAQVQFIFISHNKLAIEMAQQLTGITMSEAGVSRMVAVDVEEAIAMAAA